MMDMMVTSGDKDDGCDGDNCDECDGDKWS